MKHIIFFLVFVLLIVSFSFSQNANPQRRVAIITSLSGDVTFKSVQSAKPSKAWVGLDLLPKDTLYLGHNGSVRLLFMDSNLVKLDSNTRLIVGRSTRESCIITNNGIYQSITGLNLIAACVPCISITSLSDQSRRAFMSELKDWTKISTEPSVLPILPSKSVYRNKPVFTWFDINAQHSSGKTQDYTLIIFQYQKRDASSKDIVLKEIFRKKVSGEPRTFITFELPFTLSFNNDYEWDVFLSRREPESLEGFIPHASFRIVDSLKAQNIINMVQCCSDNRDENRIGWSEYYLLVGSYLKDQKLYAEAALEYEKLGEMLNNSYPYEELVLLYDRCGDQTRFKRSKAVEKVNNLSAPTNSDK